MQGSYLNYTLKLEILKDMHIYLRDLNILVSNDACAWMSLMILYVFILFLFLFIIKFGGVMPTSKEDIK